MKRAVIVAIAATTPACFDSIVSDPCATGFQLAGRECVARSVDPTGDAGTGSDAPNTKNPLDGNHDTIDPTDAPDAPDAPIVADAPDAPDAPVCSLDLATDPDNCGYCGHVCASGLCVAGVCAGDPAGHVVAIGHDYAQYHAAMTTVLGNAIALGDAPTVRVGWYVGTAGVVVDASTRVAAIAGLTSIGRAATHATIGSPAALDQFDAIVVEPQIRAESGTTEGASWAVPLHAWLVAGGVVVVLERPDGASTAFAREAGLFDGALADPLDASGQTASVVAFGDALAHAVPSVYLAEGGSVAWHGVQTPAIVVADDAIVFHRWVQ